MFALVPVIVLLGGISVGAFDIDTDQLDQFSVDKSELQMSSEEIAALDPFPYE